MTQKVTREKSLLVISGTDLPLDSPTVFSCSVCYLLAYLRTSTSSNTST